MPSSSSEPTRSYVAINNETVIPDTITPLAGDTTQIITPTPNVVDDAQQVTGETDDTPDTAFANIDDTPVPHSTIDEEDTKEIEDSDTPLAANGTSRYPIYLWLLLFLLLVIIEAIRKMRKDKSMNNS